MPVQKRIVTTLFFLSAVLLCSSSWAKDDKELTLFIQKVDKDLKSIDRSVSPPEADCEAKIKRPLPGLTAGFYASGAKCDSFIDSTGKLGSWGKVIDDYIKNRGAKSNFLKDNIPGFDPGFCPNWKKFTDEQKRHFWTWTFASIAWVESTCKPGAKNRQGTDGTAAGLLQMNETRANRHWRGPNCKARNIYPVETNLKCGLDIMHELLAGSAGEYKSTGALWGKKSNSYWEKLRHADGGAIAKLIRTYPLCHNQAFWTFLRNKKTLLAKGFLI